MPVEGSVRERRRAETVQEIKTAALEQVAAAGAAGLSLRAVARAVGMTVQSLYHYFDSRDALLTELLLDGHHQLADAVVAAAEASQGRSPVERMQATTGAFRTWAHANRAMFLLLFGTRVPGFEPTAAHGMGPAAARLAAPFFETVFAGWTGTELEAIPLPPGGEELAAACVPEIPIPPGALALFIELRARMHGLVMLELVGELYPYNDHGEVLFTAAMYRMAAELEALRRTLG